MLNLVAQEAWSGGDAYEVFIGRWSRPVADEFLRWLAVPAGSRWLDVGCGTGALTAQILLLTEPAQITAVDPSLPFLEHARAHVNDARVTFLIGDAQQLAQPDHAGDAVVSALALNFVPDAGRAAAEFARVTAPGGVAAAYVWDYAEGMGMLRHFWDSATAVDPAAADLDEGRRFPLCRPEPLTELFNGAGLRGVTVQAIDVPTVFADFEDFWQPFLGGQGPAPGYVASLTDAHRDELREALRASLPIDADGSIRLTARAWAVQARAI
jgi:trans-aconitate methyltransferase